MHDHKGETLRNGLTTRRRRGTRGSSWLSCVLFLGTFAGAAGRANAADFVKPTPEELAMTSLPNYPRVPAVILYKEEITKDDLHSVQRYNRIKILTE